MDVCLQSPRAVRGIPRAQRQEIELVVRKAGSLMDRAAFRPQTLPDDLVTGIALLPAVVAGLVIFKLPALQMLVIALAAGTLGLIASRLLWRRQLDRSEEHTSELQSHS